MLLKFLTIESFFLAIFSSGLPILPISRVVFSLLFSLFQVLGLPKYLPPNPHWKWKIPVTILFKAIWLVWFRLSHPGCILGLPIHYQKDPSASFVTNSVSAVHFSFLFLFLFDSSDKEREGQREGGEGVLSKLHTQCGV